ncbi:MAG: peptidoglycan domain protein [Kiritimatiellae bacterium]|nr:peptidoglycan domain protein [Kiritimatiellia bacterium]
MASFDKYAPKLKRWEGGFGNDPDDPGGATMCGVTLATFRAWYGQDKTVADLRRMTDAQWRRIMKDGFWDKCWGDQIKNQSVAEIFVDWVVNSGPAMIKKVQGLVGTTADGVLGPKTLLAINDCNPQKLHFASISGRSRTALRSTGRRSCWFRKSL